MLRIAPLFCLIVAVLAAKEVKPLERTGGGIQNFNVGKRVTGDKLIWSGSGQQVVDFARQIITEIPFPQMGSANNAVITQIVASTTLDAGTSQFTIQSGGVGQKNFNLKIVSNFARRVSYKLQIYGK